MSVCATLQSFFAKNLNNIVVVKTHESLASIQLQHTRMFYYSILTIALQFFDCDRYGNLHYRIKSS